MFPKPEGSVQGIQLPWKPKSPFYNEQRPYSSMQLSQSQELPPLNYTVYRFLSLSLSFKLTELQKP